jgi:1-acyl-sn-glycerol-3-phosphate acyltransferase
VVLSRLARGLLRLFGWRVEGEIPDHPKMVIIGGPHTSNWDFPLAMLAAGALRLRFKYLGKHTLFRWPFGWFFRMLGGIPVDRSRARGVIGDVVQAFEERERLVLVLTPEGTRSKQEYWRSGFYRIAMAVEVPVLLVGVDGPTKIIRVGPDRVPTEDLGGFMDWIREFYAPYRGVKPDNVGRIRLRDED